VDGPFMVGAGVGMAVREDGSERVAVRSWEISSTEGGVVVEEVNPSYW